MASELFHNKLGPLERIRTEGTDWIVRVQKNGLIYRLSAAMRQGIQIVRPSAIDSPAPQVRPFPASIVSNERRTLLSGFESLRKGLPPQIDFAKKLAVGLDSSKREINDFLRQVDEKGGAALIARGHYGMGKTFHLDVAEDEALSQGFITVKSEIDNAENQICRPHAITGSLLSNLRFPGTEGKGVALLARKVSEHLQQHVPAQPTRYLQAKCNSEYLKKHIGADPLACLLADPTLPTNSLLLGLLACDPGVHIPEARQAHAFWLKARMWPSFKFRTQGDFAALLFSSLGRMARLMGYRGLVVLLDEMEKWELLNPADQSRGANFLGGLVWGATEKGPRGRNDHPSCIVHSGWLGGYNFTTAERCHMGVLIALTPREDGPEEEWQQYGELGLFDLPEFTGQHVYHLCNKAAPLYAEAYGIEAPSKTELHDIYKRAAGRWVNKGATSIRDAVEFVVEELDKWRRTR